jgi:hypothetical protein
LGRAADLALAEACLPRRLRLLLRWALAAAARAMKRGFFGGGSPRASSSSAAADASPTEDDDVQGLELPKNRRRLPKKARARPRRRACHARLSRQRLCRVSCRPARLSDAAAP